MPRGSHSPSGETAFHLGMRQCVETQETTRPPWRKATPVLIVYVAFFGVFLPGLFVGLGNFIICPFSVPNGWNMPGSDARSRCDQLGAQKAAVIYTCISILYGMFIGYAVNHLLVRWARAARDYVATQRRIRDQGRQSEFDRIARERIAAQKNKLRADQAQNGRRFEELSQEEELLNKAQAAINGYEPHHSHRGRAREHGAKSSRHHRSKRDRNAKPQDIPLVSNTQLGRNTTAGPWPNMNPPPGPGPHVQLPPPAHQRGPPPGMSSIPPGPPPSGPNGGPFGPPPGLNNGPPGPPGHLMP